MAITKVWLDESSDECVSCGACEATCDAVFSVPEKMVVKEGVDFAAYENEIKDAADSCPAGVIKFSQFRAFRQSCRKFRDVTKLCLSHEIEHKKALDSIECCFCLF